MSRRADRWRDDRGVVAVSSALAPALGLLVGIAVASPDLNAQAVQPAEPAQPRDGGVSPEEIPDTFRSRVFRSPGEETPIPDVLVLKNGRKIEAYFLQAYADRLVFYFKENTRSFVREEVPRSMVASVHYGQYLERDTTEPVLIQRGRRQPVAKKNVLAGRYRGVQDRFTTWTAIFHSETNKPLPYGGDATEYGTFVIESDRVMPSGYANRIWNMGQYSLFAPRTVNNSEWVLELTEVVHTERDRTDHLSWFSGSVQDDVLILEFSPRGGFRVHWSNLSAGAWATLPQVEFQPVSGTGAGASPGDRHVPSRIHRVPLKSAPVRLVSAPPAAAPVALRPHRSTRDASSPLAEADTAGSDGSARAWVLGVDPAPPGETLRRAFLASQPRRLVSRIGQWGPPNSLWDR